jgi:LEA14-like dessication related protein
VNFVDQAVSGRWRFLHPDPLSFYVCLVLLTSCLSYKEVVLRDITNVAVERMDAKGIALRVDALLDNPNGYRIHVLDPDVDLYLNEKYIGKGFLDSIVVLQRRTEKVYSVPMHAELKGGSLLMLLLSGSFSGKDVTLGVKGTVVGKAGFLRKRFPFELEEQIQF